METELWWLSFCDVDRPVGSQFIGVALVSVPVNSTLVNAVYEAWDQGCNPGGEVMGLRIPKEDQLPLNTLLSKADCERYGVELESFE